MAASLSDARSVVPILSVLLLAGLLVVVLSNTQPPRGASNVRVENASDVVFRHVSVNGVLYGNIPPRTRSEYRLMYWPIYRYAPVHLLADGKTMTVMPFDYVGETPLEDRNVTYVLSLNQSKSKNLELAIHASVDALDIQAASGK